MHYRTDKWEIYFIVNLFFQILQTFQPYAFQLKFLCFNSRMILARKWQKGDGFVFSFLSMK